MDVTVKVIQPSGIFNIERGNQLRREINEVMQGKPDIVLLDLQDVSFMDSSGLGAVLSAYKTVKTGGAKLFLCSLNDQVKMLFELTKMDRVFETFANREDFNNAILLKP